MDSCGSPTARLATAFCSALARPMIPVRTLTTNTISQPTPGLVRRATILLHLPVSMGVCTLHGKLRDLTTEFGINAPMVPGTGILRQSILGRVSKPLRRLYSKPSTANCTWHGSLRTPMPTRRTISGSPPQLMGFIGHPPLVRGSTRTTTLLVLHTSQTFPFSMGPYTFSGEVGPHAVIKCIMRQFTSAQLSRFQLSTEDPGAPRSGTPLFTELVNSGSSLLGWMGVFGWLLVLGGPVIAT